LNRKIFDFSYSTKKGRHKTYHYRLHAMNK
jgi:hypothetical protein